MPTPSTTIVKPLPEAFPVEVTYFAGVDSAGEDVIERAGTVLMVEMTSPDGDTVRVTDKDARHNLVPLGWRPAGTAPKSARSKESS